MSARAAGRTKPVMGKPISEIKWPVRNPEFGRISAPGYWIDKNLFKKVVGVFERAGVYEGQANAHWERDGGGTYTVIKVYIKPTFGQGRA